MLSGPLSRAILEDAAEPHAGRVFCHAPANRPFVVEALARTDDGRDRWGVSGRRTVFLASDAAVALAEMARHRERGAAADERRIVRLRMQALSLVDLRRAALLRLLDLPPLDHVVADRAFARSISARVRETGACQGMVVPSVAFLDRPERPNFVLFCETLTPDIASILCDPEEVGRVRLDGS